jgi:hypothetical protein
VNAKKSVEELYEENVGRPPQNLPDDHPDRWQWEYAGSKEERDELLKRLMPAPLPAEQESLFEG